MILKNSKRTSNALKFQRKRFDSKKKNFPDKLLVFLYSNIVNFCKTDKIKGIPLLKKFIENLTGIKQKGYVIHHSHITGEIIGYAYPYCNRKVRQNYCKIPVVPHNLFKFDIFFFTERFKVWSMENLRYKYRRKKSFKHKFY